MLTIDGSPVLKMGQIIAIFHTSGNVVVLNAKPNKMEEGLAKTYTVYGIPSGPELNLFFNFLRL